MDTADSSTTRPTTFNIAVALLWLEWGVGITNAFALGASAVLVVLEFEEPDLASLAVITATYIALMFLIRGIAQGANWARFAYVPIFAVQAVRAVIQMEDAFARREAFQSYVPDPALSNPYSLDGSGLMYPPYPNLESWEFAMISAAISTAQAVILAVALLLLFAPSANRWFNPSKIWGHDRVG